MSDSPPEGIRERVFEKTFFNMGAFAGEEKGVGHTTTKEPVEGRDMRFLENIEVSTHDGWYRRVVQKHRSFELPQSLGRVRECEV